MRGCGWGEVEARSFRSGYALRVTPIEIIAESTTPDGARIRLAREQGNLVIRINQISLMSSRIQGSEMRMAEISCAGLRSDALVLVGGLGMGYTLRATLDQLGPSGKVVVAELLPVLVEWNRGPLGPLAGHPLQDPRVQLVQDDVGRLLRNGQGRYDVVLLDVDNGPDAFTAPQNAWLYGQQGLRAALSALRPGGTMVVWSAWPCPPFEAAMRRAGFHASTQRVYARGAIKKGARHFLFVGRRPQAGARVNVS